MEWFSDGPPIPVSQSVSWFGPVTHSDMVDVIDNKGSKPDVIFTDSKWHMNYCDHDQWQSSFSYLAPGPVQVSTVDIRTDSSLIAQGCQFYPIGSLVKDSNILFDHYPYPAKYLERFFADPSIPTKIDIDKDPFDTSFSLWYLVVDLKDLGKLLPELLGHGNLARVANLGSGNLAKTGRQLANDHLLTQFGVLPTIQDMKDFLHLVFHWREKYDDVFALTHKGHGWRAKPLDLSSKFHQSFRSGNSSFLGTNIPVRVFLDEPVVVHNRAAKYRFTCPEFTGWLARLAQFCDAFGVADPAAVWDNVPFSFVVDWFFNVTKWLHRNRPRFYPCNIEILDYCESIRLELNTRWYFTFYNAGGDPRYNSSIIPTESHLCDVKYTTYVRRQFQPPPTFVSLPQMPLTSFLKPGRASIVAALLGQRLIPRR